MDHLIEYIYLAEYVAPVFTALGGMILLFFSYENRFSHTEARIKRTAFWYLCASFVSSVGIAFYVYAPEAFVAVQSLFYFALLYAEVLFYALFHMLSAEDGRERLSRWHFWVPLVIVLPLAVWSVFVPYEVQLEITVGLRKVVPAGYGAYTGLYISKQPVTLFYCVFYLTLTVVRLVRYYRAINASSSLVRRPARWALWLLAFMLTSVFVSGLAAFIQRHQGLYLSHVVGIASVTMVAQHIVLTFVVVRRRYVLYILPQKQEEEPQQGEPVQKRWHRPYAQGSGSLLTRKRFDAWMREQKPYLDPSYKLTDLAEAMGINRSYVSRFINRTYGVNFNRYMNRLRLKEVERLVALPSNGGRPLAELTGKAG